ncbi:MAG: HAMP domain-containing histidine kinase [Halobacteriales archaeon]|nr:HAMP domain-containing histidine kinase [Halobacteriales archaeon]
MTPGLPPAEAARASHAADGHAAPTRAAQEPFSLAGLRTWLPTGGGLPEAALRTRHRYILVLVAAHVPALFAYGLWQGRPWTHVTLEVALIAAIVVAAAATAHRARLSGTLASIGLISCSALLTHLSGGYIEAHFHFFVSVIIISLYEDWVPFLVAIAYVVLHHGVVGVLDPRSVYNHADAYAQPWVWAGIHGGFVLAASAASMVNWKLNEQARSQAEAAQALERAAQTELAENAQRVEAFRTNLLNIAAHELRTPLTPIRLQVDLLRTSGLNQRQERVVTVLDRNLDRLANVLSDLLDVSRLESGRFQLQTLPSDLRALAEESLASFGPLAAERGVALELTGSPVGAMADAVRLGQVVDNLLSNALKFTSAGGRVTVELGTEGGHAALRVRDSGIGIEPADLGKLFQPFSQVHDARSHPKGTGLGLYICKGIVEQHGGTIRAESAGRGQGTLFVVTLPPAALPAPLAPVPAASQDPALAGIAR